MRIEHIAFWVSDLEGMRQFYQKYFNAVAGSKYENPGKGFKSYFLEFKGGSRLEIMKSRDVIHTGSKDGVSYGYAHFAVSVGSKKKVDEMTSQFEADGFSVIAAPRLTGDGYYESVILDPEGNRIELMA